MKPVYALLNLLTVVVLVAAAGQVRAAAPEPVSAPRPKTLPTIKESKEATDGNISGTVVETMDAAGYTYICVEQAGTKTWVAVPEMKVAVGKSAVFLPGQEMKNFESKSLGRTFESIIFSAGPVSAAKAGGMPSGHPSGGPSADGAVSGKVVETMNAAGYTYVCVEKAGRKTWVAIPETKVTVGKTMSFAPGQEMANFTSKTLNRTFASIIFSSGPLSASSKAPAKNAAVSTASEKNLKVEKAAGPDAYTIAEIFRQRAALNGKAIRVRAKVVKVSMGIMGKNWVHLQDGTGDAKKNTHNLVATTQDIPQKDEIVTMTGTLVKDKDFGAGYNYEAIIENATLVK